MGQGGGDCRDGDAAALRVCSITVACRLRPRSSRNAKGRNGRSIPPLTCRNAPSDLSAPSIQAKRGEGVEGGQWGPHDVTTINLQPPMVSPRPWHPARALRQLPNTQQTILPCRIPLPDTFVHDSARPRPFFTAASRRCLHKPRLCMRRRWHNHLI